MFCARNLWRTGGVETHVDPTLIHLIESENYAKSEKDRVKIKLCRDPKSENLDLYELKMALFDNYRTG